MSVSDALESLDGGRATVRINSPGGSADEGIAIYNTLKRYAGGVDTINEALAASAASVIFLAGETRTMSAGSRLMIHRALTIEIGNADRMRKPLMSSKRMTSRLSKYIRNTWTTPKKKSCLCSRLRHGTRQKTQFRQVWLLLRLKRSLKLRLQWPHGSRIRLKILPSSLIAATS